ncbi:MAG: hypothetical protein AAF198_08590 [Pseudomonadota bacterium]
MPTEEEFTKLQTTVNSLTSLIEKIINIGFFVVLIAGVALIWLVVINAPNTRQSITDRINEQFEAQIVPLVQQVDRHELSLQDLSDGGNGIGEMQLFLCPSSLEAPSDLAWMSRGCVGQITSLESCTDIAATTDGELVREVLTCEPL